jgi:threonine dehydrogenase-like Zn-dependent dehydrogenase
MKAVFLRRATEELEIREIPAPIPGKDEIIVRVKQVLLTPDSLNCHALKIDEVIPGRFFTGEVVEAGPGVLDFDTGDMVTSTPIFYCGECRYCNSGKEHLCPDQKIAGRDREGFLSEYVKVPHRYLWKIPQELTPQRGLFQPLFAVLLQFIPESIVPGNTCIIATNCIEGIVFSKIAQISGILRTIIFSTTQRLRSFIQPDLRTLYTDEISTFTSICSELQEEIELGIELAGNQDLLKLMLKNVKNQGTIFYRKDGASEIVNDEILREAEGKGIVLRSENHINQHKRMQYALRLLLTHAIEVDSYITHTFDLEDFQRITRILTKEPALIRVNL